VTALGTADLLARFGIGAGVQGAAPPADLALTTIDFPDPVPPGGFLAYVLDARNNGPNPAASVVVLDLLPRTVAFEWTSPGCTALPVPTLETTAVGCTIGTLAAGATARAVIVGRQAAAGQAANVAQVVSAAGAPDPAPANNTSVTVTTFGPLPTPPVIATIVVGNNTLGVDVNPATNRVYAAHNGGSRVSVIDGAANAVSTTVPLPNPPIAVGTNPSTNRVYAPVQGSAAGDLYVLDGATNAVVATVTVGDSPRYIAVNPATNRLYTDYNFSSLAVSDGSANTLLATVPLAFEVFDVAVNSRTNRVYAAHGRGPEFAVSVIDGATNAVATVVPIPGGVASIAVNDTTNRVYVGGCAVPGVCSVSVIDGTSNTVTASVPVHRQPNALAVNPTTNRVYALLIQSGSIAVIDGATHALAATWGLLGAIDAAVNPATNRLYVSAAGVIHVIQD
jgi:uncharacterized repeat protein (TIGR01451 family)